LQSVSSYVYPPIGMLVTHLPVAYSRLVSGGK